MIKRNNTNNTQLLPIISNTDNIAKNILDAHFDNWRYKTEYISELMLVDILLLPLLDSDKSHMLSLTKVSGNNNYIGNTIIYEFSNYHMNQRFLYITYSKNTYIVHIQFPVINTTVEIGQTRNVFEILWIIKDLATYGSSNGYEKNSSIPYYNNPLYINYFLTHKRRAWTHILFQSILIDMLKHEAIYSQDLNGILGALNFEICYPKTQYVNLTNYRIREILLDTYVKNDNDKIETYKLVYTIPDKTYDDEVNGITEGTNKVNAEKLCSILGNQYKLGEIKNGCAQITLNNTNYNGSYSLIHITNILFNLLIHYVNSHINLTCK